MRTRWRGVDTSKYVRKKVPFCTYFVIVSYTGDFYHTLLSLASTFITLLQNICYDYIPISQMFYSLFVHVIIYWIFKTFPLEMGEGSDGLECVRNGGGRSMLACAYDTVRGQILSFRYRFIKHLL